MDTYWRIKLFSAQKKNTMMHSCHLPTAEQIHSVGDVELKRVVDVSVENDLLVTLFFNQFLSDRFWMTPLCTLGHCDKNFSQLFEYLHGSWGNECNTSDFRSEKYSYWCAFGCKSVYNVDLFTLPCTMSLYITTRYIRRILLPRVTQLCVQSSTLGGHFGCSD